MHFKGHEELVSRVLDLQEKAKRYQKVVFTPFLNAFEQEIVQKISKHFIINYSGGCVEAERKMAAIALVESEVKFPIVCLQAKFNDEYYEIEHKDVLGTLMSLGIKKHVIGDILVEEDCIYLFVTKEAAPFIIEECRQIKRCHVLWNSYEEEVVSNKTLLWEEKNVSSFRLDTVVAAICNVNRDKAKKFIMNGNVKVNQVVLEDCKYLCHNNNTISIRGFGRFFLEKNTRLTKKERHVMLIGKYI